MRGGCARILRVQARSILRRHAFPSPLALGSRRLHPLRHGQTVRRLPDIPILVKGLLSYVPETMNWPMAH